MVRMRLRWQVLLQHGGRLCFASSLLQLRGAAPTQTPLRSRHGDLLLFKGAPLQETILLPFEPSLLHLFTSRAGQCYSVLILHAVYPARYSASRPLLHASCHRLAQHFCEHMPMCAAAVSAGEVFGGLHVPAGASDAAALFAALQRASCALAPHQASTTDVTSDDGSAGVPGLLSRLRGPWSLVFWAAKTEV